jgi:hypothetical protein
LLGESEMREITTHHDGLGLNDLIRVEASDEDANGVPHRIEFWRTVQPKECIDPSTDENPTKDLRMFRIGENGRELLVGFLAFQRGPRNVEGSSAGLISDAVYAALIDIMQGFQSGPFKSREGAIVLTKLEEAALWSNKRARDRAARGVLGHNKA